MENNNNKKLFIYIVFVLVAVFGVIYFFMQSNLNYQPPAPIANQQPPTQATDTSTNPNNLPVRFIIYYGDTCPHCKVVEEYIQKNNTQAKLGIQLKEVFKNQDNSADLVARAKSCGKNTDEIGVPFLFDLQTSKCVVGDKPIIELFDAEVKGK